MKKFEFCVKWLSTVIILLATVATSFDFTPLNKWLFLLGSLGWAVVGLVWRQPSLYILNFITATIYCIGILS
jgi:hypothetical protein